MANDSGAGSKVTVSGLTKQFGKLLVLDDVSFTVDEAEFLAIVGPTGCGKTTFLNIVAGLIEPTSGQVLINGQKISGPGPERNVVFQEYGLLPWRTVEDNIKFN